VYTTRRRSAFNTGDGYHTADTVPCGTLAVSINNIAGKAGSTAKTLLGKLF
jgi:hypothetical protein